ncbi:MAG: hypothetical protein R6V56_00930, partial [Lentisphaeria bacterium]
MTLSSYFNFEEKFDLKDDKNESGGWDQTLGGRIRWQVNDDCTIDFDGMHYKYADGPDTRRYTAGVNYTLPNNHIIRVDMRHNTTSGNDDSNSVFISYNIPFSLPVTRRKSVGAVKGRVFTRGADRRDLKGL